MAGPSGPRHAAAAVDRQKTNAERCEAIDLAAYSGRANAEIAKLAIDEPTPAVRLRALAALAGLKDLESWRTLLGRFSQEPAAIRSAILDGVLAKPDRTSLLLDELAAGRDRPG